MDKHSGTRRWARDLRRQAEVMLRRKPARRVSPPSPDSLVHELQVHQVELEMQNEELRRTQVDLAESRDRYYALYDLAPVGYLTLDHAGTVHEANLVAAELVGVERAHLLGRPLVSFMDEKDADTLYLHLQQVFAHRSRQSIELTLVDPDAGKTRPVRIDSTQFGDAEQVGSHCHSVMIDLSELRQAEAGRRRFESRTRRAETELRRSERRLREIAQHLEDVLATIDRDSRRVVYASPAFERIWGRPPSALDEPGVQLTSWIHAEDRQRVDGELVALGRGIPFDEEFRIQRPDGELRWIRARIFPSAPEEDGGGHHDVAIMQDVTEERQLAEELRQAQKMEAVGVLASGVAHDFNNVLQAILGCISIARDDDTAADEVQDYLDRAVVAANRGGDLAAQLMAFSRKQRAQARPVLIDTVVGSMAQLIERLVTEQIAVSIELGAAEATVMADAVQIDQILMNLAANARDAMPGGGQLTIRTTVVDRASLAAHHADVDRAQRYVCLTVQDSGIGMDEKTRNRIFEPFFTTKEVGEGTGLGLSTVFNVTKQLGGHIEVQSQPNRGTIFTLCLPCIEQAAISAATREQWVPAHLEGTVLLVEDEPLVRMTVSHYLEELGLRVLVAESGTQALELCRNSPEAIDVLVSDIVLPGLRGPKLAALLRQLAPELRVLFMSANPELMADEVQILEHAPVLEKPFDLDQLAEALGELLAKP